MEHLDDVFETGLVITLLLYLIFGEPSYGRVPTTGQYAVGFKEFTTDTTFNDCSIYYPIDHKAYKNSDSRGENYVYLMRHVKSLKSYVKAVGWRNGMSKGFNE